MDTKIVTPRQAASLAALIGRDTSTLVVGQEGFLMPFHGCKLRLIDTVAGPQFALAGYTPDNSDIDEALALVS